jgi:transposase
MSNARHAHTCFGATYKRIASRHGPAKALVAVQYAMLTAIWNEPPPKPRRHAL